MVGYAIHYGAQCSSRKARLLRPLVIGKSVDHALAILKVNRRSGSVPLMKVLKSAAAQFNDPLGDILVREVTINEGPKRKKFMPRAQGRAFPIFKKTSHISVQLSSFEYIKRAINERVEQSMTKEEV